MAGFQTMEMPRPRFGNGAAVMPIVDVRLVGRREPPIEINPKTGLALITPSLIEKMRQLHASGLTRAAIAVACKTSRKTVYKFCPNEPGSDRSRVLSTERLPFNLPKAQRMRRAGFSFEEIAADQGMSRETAQKNLRLAEGMAPRTKAQVRTPAGRLTREVYQITGLKREDIFRNLDGPSRSERPDFVKARHLCFWLFYRRLEMSAVKVGEYLGGFDHTSVLNGVRRVEEAAESLGISLDGSKMGTFRKLWVAEWPSRKAA